MSRARRVSENAFGMLVSKWTLFASRIDLNCLETINECIQAGIAIHNWVLTEKLDNSSRIAYQNNNLSIDILTEDPQSMRDDLKNYFLNEGLRQWQYSEVLCGHRKNM